PPGAAGNGVAGVALHGAAGPAAAVEPIPRGDAAALVGAERLFVFGVVEDRLDGLAVAAMRELWPVDHLGAGTGGVLQAQLSRVHADLFRQHVDRALDREGRDRRTRRAVGGGFRPVAHDVVADGVRV